MNLFEAINLFMLSIDRFSFFPPKFRYDRLLLDVLLRMPKYNKTPESVCAVYTDHKVK